MELVPHAGTGERTGPCMVEQIRTSELARLYIPIIGPDGMPDSGERIGYDECRWEKYGGSPLAYFFTW